MNSKTKELLLILLKKYEEELDCTHHCSSCEWGVQVVDDTLHVCPIRCSIDLIDTKENHSDNWKKWRG